MIPIQISGYEDYKEIVKGDSMKLLTKELIDRFAKVGSQEEVKDPIVIAKFFNPMGRGYWFATEYNPEDKIFFGYVSLFGDYNDEWGSFSLEELESLQLPMGMKIERDMYFGEKPSSEIIKEYTNV
jgi:hypothetical protein